MPDGSDISQARWRLGVAIAQIARRWRVRLDQRILPFGLTESRWLVLLSLARRGDGVTQRDLAGRLAVEGPTMVRTLDWLEAQGFVERRAAPGDRRAKTIHLTEAARPVLAEILEGIPEEDLAMCLAVLDRVAQGLARTEGGA